jgi:hypothetical protein
MQTWLDEWCKGMRFRRIQQLTELGRRRDEYCRSDGLAAREAALDALGASLSFQERHEGVPLPIAFMSMFAPFFVTPKGESIVRAYQVTSGLAELLEEVELTPASVSRTREMVGPGWATYIDVPSGVIPIGMAAELRAIFVQPTEAERETLDLGQQPQENLSYCAVVAPRREYGWRHALWTDDRAQFLVDNVRREWGAPVVAAMPTFDEFLEQADWTKERFQDEAERLAYLVLEHARDPAQAIAEDVPYMAANHERRIPGRARAVADRFSLFKIVRLRPRNEGLGNPEPGGERRPWRLGKRITVKPHWRRVRVRGTSETRWIPVREHQKGPANGLPVHAMQRVQTTREAPEDA